MKKYEHCIFIFAFIFISEALSVEKPPLNPQICIDPLKSTEDIQLLANNRSFSVLIRAMQAFEPPKMLKKTGAENIEITEHPINEIFRGSNPEPIRLYYYISFPVHGQTRQIDLIIRRPTSASFNAAPNDTEILELLRRILGSLPAQVLNALKNEPSNVIIDYANNTTRSNAGFHKTIDPDKTEIVIFPLKHSSNDKLPFFSSIQHSLQHEIGGHAMAFQIYGTTHPDQKWHDAILADGTSVSDYGDTNSNEDFAEAATLYLKTDGGLYYPYITRKHTHRFAILDESMGVTSDERRRINEINHLFEIQTNDLLRKLDLPTGYPEIGNLRYDVIPNKTKAFLESEGGLSDEKLAELLRDLWRNHPEYIEISAVLANKIHTLQRERALKPDSVEILLKRAILENLFWNDHIPEFIKDTIYSLDTLSVSEMERRFYILNQVYEAYIGYYIIAYSLRRDTIQVVEPFIVPETFEEILENIEQ